MFEKFTVIAPVTHPFWKWEIAPKMYNYRERLIAVPKTGEKYDVETTNSSDEIL